jgi:hypothetical protein
LFTFVSLTSSLVLCFDIIIFARWTASNMRTIACGLRNTSDKTVPTIVMIYYFVLLHFLNYIAM